MKAYFLSDQHLHSNDQQECQALLHFFRSLKSSEDCSHLFLVGDIFDLWAGPHDYFIKKWQSFNAEILRLVSLGTQVHYFEGNHDLLLADYYSKQLGVHVYDSAQYFTINNKVYRVEHGDQMDPEDKNYLLLRSFWRSKIISYLIKNVSGNLISKIGESASDFSRQQQTAKPDQAHIQRIKNTIDSHIKTAYSEKPFDIFVAGHVHIKDERLIDVGQNKQVLAINLGYQEAPRTI